MKRALVLLVAASTLTSLARCSAPAPGQEDVVAETRVVAAEKATSASPTDNLQKMRAELVALTKARAELMTSEELVREIARAKVETERIRAQREVERAKAILVEVAEKHPDTPAGRAARNALATLRQPQEPHPDPISRPAVNPFDFEPRRSGTTRRRTDESSKAFLEPANAGPREPADAFNPVDR